MRNRNGKTAPAVPKTAGKVYAIPETTRNTLSKLVAERDAALQAAQNVSAQIGAILTTMSQIMEIPAHGYTVNLANLDWGIFPTPEEPAPDPTSGEEENTTAIEPRTATASVEAVTAPA